MKAEDIEEPDLVTIPAGVFLMGSETGRDDEKPVHSVWVDAFAMAIYPVRRREICSLPPGHRASANEVLDRRQISAPESARRGSQLVRRGLLLRVVIRDDREALPSAY